MAAAKEFFSRKGFHATTIADTAAKPLAQAGLAYGSAYQDRRDFGADRRRVCIDGVERARRAGFRGRFPALGAHKDADRARPAALTGKKL